jgi:hypothetical protein
VLVVAGGCGAPRRFFANRAFAGAPGSMMPDGYDSRVAPGANLPVIN